MGPDRWSTAVPNAFGFESSPAPPLVGSADEDPTAEVGVPGVLWPPGAVFADDVFAAGEYTILRTWIVSVSLTRCDAVDPVEDSDTIRLSNIISMSQPYKKNYIL